MLWFGGEISGMHSPPDKRLFGQCPHTHTGWKPAHQNNCFSHCSQCSDAFFLIYSSQQSAFVFTRTWFETEQDLWCMFNPPQNRRCAGLPGSVSPTEMLRPPQTSVTLLHSKCQGLFTDAAIFFFQTKLVVFDPASKLLTCCVCNVKIFFLFGETADSE